MWVSFFFWTLTLFCLKSTWKYCHKYFSFPGCFGYFCGLCLMMQNADNLGAFSSSATFLILIVIIKNLMRITRREHVALLLDVLLHSLHSYASAQVFSHSCSSSLWSGQGSEQAFFKLAHYNDPAQGKLCLRRVIAEPINTVSQQFLRINFRKYNTFYFISICSTHPTQFIQARQLPKKNSRISLTHKMLLRSKAREKYNIEVNISNCDICVLHFIILSFAFAILSKCQEVQH